MILRLISNLTRGGSRGAVKTHLNWIIPQAKGHVTFLKRDDWIIETNLRPATSKYVAVRPDGCISRIVKMAERFVHSTSMLLSSELGSLPN